MYLTPSGENPREFEPRRYHFPFSPAAREILSVLLQSIYLFQTARHVNQWTF